MMVWGLIIGVSAVALITAAVIVVLRLLAGRVNHPPVPLPPMAEAQQNPRQILDERYAKGDLATEKYLERDKYLGSARLPRLGGQPASALHR